MPESFEEVCANIKACLNTSKNQVSMFDLNRDYNAILGMNIPYTALGFRSLESLLRAVPDLKITQIGRDIFIDVKADEKTMHITKLVRDQKTNKKKPPVTVGKQNGRSVSNNLTKHYSLDEDHEYSSMNSCSNNSHQIPWDDEDYAPRNSTPKSYRNDNSRRGGSRGGARGGDLTHSRRVEPEGSKLKVTISNNGPRDYIKLFYEEERRMKR